MSKIFIGQEIEGYCGKCKNDTLHIITAIDDDKIEKVMCKVCMSYHKFKKPADSSPELVIKKTAKAKKTTKPTKTLLAPAGVRLATRNTVAWYVSSLR